MLSKFYSTLVLLLNVFSKVYSCVSYFTHALVLSTHTIGRILLNIHTSVYSSFQVIVDSTFYSIFWGVFTRLFLRWRSGRLKASLLWLLTSGIMSSWSKILVFWLNFSHIKNPVPKRFICWIFIHVDFPCKEKLGLYARLKCDSSHKNVLWKNTPYGCVRNMSFFLFLRRAIYIINCHE